MTRDLPRYVTRFVSQHGSVRLVFRRKDFPTYYFVGRARSAEFKAEYAACLAGVPPEKTARRSYRPARPARAIADREGRVYFIGAGGGPIKIGFSSAIRKRLAVLQSNSPHRLKVIASIKGSMALERALHQQFAHLRMQGEWFRRAPELLAEIGRVKRGAISHLVDGGEKLPHANPQETVTL